MPPVFLWVAWYPPLTDRFDCILANPQPGPVAGWSKSKNWSWCDALFMAPPTWAELGRQTNDLRYLDFMNNRWWETYDLLYDNDGLWPANLADNEEFPGPESSGSAFFCYGLAWKLRHGLLDQKTYLPAVGRAWWGLSRCVDADGKLGYAQRVSHRPVAVAPNHSMEYATGALLLAGREVRGLIP